MCSCAWPHPQNLTIRTGVRDAVKACEQCTPMLGMVLLLHAIVLHSCAARDFVSAGRCCRLGMLVSGAMPAQEPRLRTPYCVS